MPSVPANYLELNRRLWNAKTAHHVASDFYNVPGFLAGQSSLNEVELGLLGEVTRPADSASAVSLRAGFLVAEPVGGAGNGR
ncbi:hypothetical protein [Hymenobacter swuensis]|uniref:Uncharacterized protein n=1 Tax=Hymenobacter swuensis DY53 TaxID=1227739 RepID=W8EUX9_9BACT|nr:hypothetical protein [Hymenobacter swuensis]AHJ97009.1 hypothetical protein Hsw_1414 [Hymenobacter swuensis DY53]